MGEQHMGLPSDGVPPSLVSLLKMLIIGWLVGITYPYTR